MAKARNGLLAILFVTVAPPIFAADIYSISFLPQTPVAGQSVVAHLSSSYGPLCTPDPGSVGTDGATITLSIELEDFCSPEDVSYRDFPLGTTGAGVYTVIFQTCMSFPAPQVRTCRTELQTQLIVGNVPASLVPSLSSLGLLVLIFGLIAGVAKTLPLRRRD